MDIKEDPQHLQKRHICREKTGGTTQPESTLPPMSRTDIYAFHLRQNEAHVTVIFSYLYLAKKEVVRGLTTEWIFAETVGTAACCRPVDQNDLLSDAFRGETELCFILPQGMWVSGLDRGKVSILFILI